MPPKSKGDYGFITHMIEIAKRHSGRVAVIVPHGVLFRGGAEGRIRRALIEENLLDAVVGLPANLFTTTGIPVAVLIFDRSREEGGQHAARKDVLFIDASREFTPGKTQNVMDEAHIAKVVETFRTRAAIETSTRTGPAPRRSPKTTSISTFPATWIPLSPRKRLTLPPCKRRSIRLRLSWPRFVGV